MQFINNVPVYFFTYMCSTADLGSYTLCVSEKMCPEYMNPREEDMENYIIMCFITYTLHITLVKVIKLWNMTSQALKRCKSVD